MKNLVEKIFKEYLSREQNSGTQNEFYDWLLNNDSQEEKDEELKKIWASIPKKEDSSTHYSWNKFKLRIAPGTKQRYLLLWQSIAALFILVSGSLLYILIQQKDTFTSDLVEQYTQVAHVDSIYLPDGTLVHLNATTTLLYPTEFKGNTRSIYLIGEAIFDIKRDPKKPFIVKTSDCNITALGTHFNVEAYPNENEVRTTLLSGKIEVENIRENTKTILEPNQQYTYNKSTANSSISNIDTEVITSWKKGELTIQNKSIKEIINILERKYPITFQYNWDLVEKKDEYNFKFKMEAPIEEVLNVIKTVSGIDYTIKENVCYLNQ